ncbi:MAG: hypothetical protein V3T79_00810 [Candidatus Scalindua sediminis]|jgi:hypothetical protein
MSDSDSKRAQWLKDSEKYFRHVQSYNRTVITVGYATFFAALLFLSEKTSSPLVFWALLFLVVSAAIFVTYEMVTAITLAVQASKAGKEGKRLFRFWAAFFVPSLLLGVIGLAILVGIILCQL